MAGLPAPTNCTRRALESVLKLTRAAGSKHWTKTGALALSKSLLFNAAASRASIGRPMLARKAGCFISG